MFLLKEIDEGIYLELCCMEKKKTWQDVVICFGLKNPSNKKMWQVLLMF